MKSNKKYLMLVLIYLVGVAAPVNQFKVPPMMRQLMENLNIELGVSGWLMSVFALVGLIFAVPAGVFLQRAGNRRAGIIGLVTMLIGSVTGGFANSMPLMLASRVFEGAGMCLYSITAPAAIAAWFPKGNRGMAMGIWGTWVPVGTIIMFIVAPALSDGGWRHVWLFAALYTAAALLLYVLFFRMPDEFEKETAAGVAAPVPKGAIKGACLLAAAFMLFNMITISVKSYLPVFLETMRVYTKSGATNTANLMMIVSVVMGPVGGMISDRIGSRKKVLVTGCVIACLTAAVPFTMGGLSVPISLMLLGISGGTIAVSVFSSSSEVMGHPSRAGTGLSIVAFGQYLGMFCGPVFFSTNAAAFGWATAGYLLIPLALGATILALIVKIR